MPNIFRVFKIPTLAITLLTFFLLFGTVTISQGRQAGGIKTKTTDTFCFMVYGECDMCKERIEKNALSLTGVLEANWNANTRILKIRYKSGIPSTRLKIQQKMLEIGHDTQFASATENAYNQLPECCHYKRKEQHVEAIKPKP